MSEENKKPENQEGQSNKEVKETSEESATSSNQVIDDMSEKLQEENSKLRDQSLRLAAEMENTKRRMAKEIEEAGKYALTKFARDLIDVLENLYRAESSIQSSEELESNQTLKAIFSGVELTKKSLVDVFEKNGIKRVEPEAGSKFDHHYHQAITQVQATNQPNDSIVQVVQAGYVIHDRLLRPALVVVAKS